MKNYEEMQKKLSDMNNLKKAVESYQRAVENTDTDKYGFGFNKDSRFCAVKIELSLDTWTGQYGNSSCSTILDMNNRQISEFRKNFVAVLNNNINRLMQEVIERMRDEAMENRSHAIVEVNNFLKEMGELDGNDPGLA